jgi:hypothetical protein
MIACRAVPRATPYFAHQLVLAGHLVSGLQLAGRDRRAQQISDLPVPRPIGLRINHPGHKTLSPAAPLDNPEASALKESLSGHSREQSSALSIASAHRQEAAAQTRRARRRPGSFPSLRISA